VSSQPLATGSDQAVYDRQSPLLEIDDLYVEFQSRRHTVAALNGISYQVAARETLAVVGESGSGKSVSAQTVMGILDSPPARIVSGAIRYAGTDILALPERERRRLRADKIAMIFQDALSALNPVYTVGEQIAEMFRVHRGASHAAARARAVEMMERVRIPDARRRVGDYPHQFSGGMRQRIMIAIALALEPEVLIADEPTTALDATVQAQIMRLLAELKQESNLALILITHDLGVVAEVADRVAVVYAGRVVEEGGAEQVFLSPAHPYTRGLLASIPQLARHERRLATIPGSPPTLAQPPQDCPFAPRCSHAKPLCSQQLPPPLEVEARHRSACHFAKEVIGGG
jgi:oligopeptide transport system ATP-binding protein